MNPSAVAVLGLALVYVASWGLGRLVAEVRAGNGPNRPVRPSRRSAAPTPRFNAECLNAKARGPPERRDILESERRRP